MNERVARLRERTDEPFLVTSPFNVFYFTGLQSTNAALLVDQQRVQVFTDFRYAQRARAIEGAEVVEVPRNIYSGVREHLSGRVGFESMQLTHAAHAALGTDGVELVPYDDLLERIRAVKEPGELDAIRAATEITNDVFARLTEQRFVGSTERELAWWIERELREAGAEGVSFPPVVAAGANASSPHAEPGARPIEQGMLVIVDAGAKVDGYCSDCTRTFSTGDLPEELERAYEVCLRAQQEALGAVRAGSAVRDVDAVARRIIDGEGFAGLFGHGLGHGVGLQIHELPGMRPESEDVLETANAVTVEPGIYMPGVGGVRIEDLVLVTDDGCEVLTSTTKELTNVR